MPNIYEWLFEHYAMPQLENLEADQDAVLNQLAEHLTLTRRQRRSMLDILENLRLQWGTEAFAVGVRFGRDLVGPRVPPMDCSQLLNFLP